MNTLKTSLKSGLTLIELTVVIVVVLTISTAGFFSFSAYDDWKKGAAASQTLKQVYVAQRFYLSDNPNADVTKLTRATLLTYLQNSPETFPTIEDLDGNQLEIDVSVTPPMIEGGYDPSGNNSDGVWDVGNF